MHQGKDTKRKTLVLEPTVWTFRVLFFDVLYLFYKVLLIVIKSNLLKSNLGSNLSAYLHLPGIGHMYCPQRLKMKLLILLWLFSVPSLSFSQPISFTDVSTKAGINYTGPSFGASWGDANGDGLPDLWLGNHGKNPHLYINKGDGSFVEQSSIIDFTSKADMHGAAWADYDNDGDQDLLVMVGAQSGTGDGPNQFFVNNSGLFTDEAQQMKLDYPLGRGRTPMWLDWDNDGLLDVMLNNWGRLDLQAPTALFGQSNNGFTNTFDITGISDNDENSYSQIVMMGSEARPHIMITRRPYSAKFYDYQQQPAIDISSMSGLPEFILGARDTVVADFNGDLLSDMLVLRNSDVSNFVQLDATRAKARLVMENGEIGIRVKVVGTLEVALNPAGQVSGSTIFIGAGEINPSSTTFILDPENIGMHGIPSHQAGIDSGVYIGYSGDQEWTILISRDSWMGINAEFTSTEQITSIEPVGFTESDGAMPDQMYVQIDGAGFDFVDETVSGLGDDTPCAVGTAADFDNDMDVDIYLVCSGPVSNKDNRLLVNDGNGRFTPATDAWGATANVSGLGEVAASADYDGDGFVDLLVTNGNGVPPFNVGQTLLFNNQGNANHWLAIELEGLASNRDAIGARVILSAGGKLQLREQLGGMHQYSQDYSRLQFGLAENTQVDRIDIYWPSGTVETLLNVPANQVIHVIESKGITKLPPPQTAASNNVGGSGSSAVSFYTLSLLLLLSCFRTIRRKR